MSLICAAVTALPLLGCRSAEGGESAEVVATTTQVADIAQRVTEGEASVHGILPPSADPHDYEPRPSDAAAIAGAKLLITSGGEVDEWVAELIESSGTDAQVLSLLEAAPHAGEDGAGEADPHWWQDPRNAIAAVNAIRDELTSVEPARSRVFAENAREFTTEIRRTDRGIARCISSLPARARKLVTSHDSLGLFAERYDIEVIGAAVPALSTQAQPSSGETADLVDLIREERVPAVFPESGLSGELENAIAEEAGVTVGGELYADALGEEGSPGETYISALWANAGELVQGLSRDAQDCSPLGNP